jgi:hypothetical protein
MSKYLARLNAIIQEKPLPKEPSKPSKVAFEPFEGDQGRRISGIERPPEPDQAELGERKGIALLRKEVEAGAQPARSLEQETYRRLPEVVAARGDPPAPSSVPPLKEQGDYCASRGMDYLSAFWKEAYLGGEAPCRRQGRAGRLEEDRSRSFSFRDIGKWMSD